MTEDLSLAPFRFLVREDGTHELLLFDGDMVEVEEVFDALDAEANGYGWESLASWLTHAEMPDVVESIRFISEAGTFVAASSEPTALRRLAERLHCVSRPIDAGATHLRSRDRLTLRGASSLIGAVPSLPRAA